MKRRVSMLMGPMLLGTLALLGIAALIVLVSSGVAAVAQDQAVAAPAAAQAQPMPHYDAKGELQLPADWRRWIFVGSSLGLSYTQGDPGMQMFHETLMEPSAYQHFTETGTFREGTMFVLVMHGTGDGVLPGRHGKFAADLMEVEMAVKDKAHRPEGWSYYIFGGMNGINKTAATQPKEACYNCHVQHARRDNVFVQFYPMLEDMAPRATAARP